MVDYWWVGPLVVFLVAYLAVKLWLRHDCERRQKCRDALEAAERRGVGLPGRNNSWRLSSGLRPLVISPEPHLIARLQSIPGHVAIRHTLGDSGRNMTLVNVRGGVEVRP